MNQTPDPTIFEDDEPKPLDPGAVKDITFLARKMAVLDGEFDESQAEDIFHFVSKYISNAFKGEVSLKTLQAVYLRFEEIRRKICQELIPAQMSNCELTALELNTGEFVKVEDKLKASFKKDIVDTVISDMVSEEKEYKKISEQEVDEEEIKVNILSLFKQKIIIEVPADQEEKFKQFKDDLVSKDLPYEHKKDIHHATLNKYCKAVEAGGRQIPNSIKVFRYKETKIK